MTKTTNDRSRTGLQWTLGLLAAAPMILKRGGHLISISGPPDHHFGREIGAPWIVSTLLRLMSVSVRRQARRLGVHYSFLSMKANGVELQRITGLIDSGVMRPVMDKVFHFDHTNHRVRHTGRAKGKVVVTMQGRST